MGKDPRRDGSMERVRNRMLAKNGRSPLYAWFQENYDGFVDALRVVRRPDWSEIAAALTDEGVLDGAGKPPTPTTVRQTWHKVKTDRSKPVAGKRPKAQPTAVRDGVVEIVRGPETKPEPKASSDRDPWVDEMLAKADKGTIHEHLPKRRKE
jgi:hypothetical protein